MHGGMREGAGRPKGSTKARKAQVSAQIEPSIAQQIEALAAAQKQTLSQCVARLVKKGLSLEGIDFKKGGDAMVFLIQVEPVTDPGFEGQWIAVIPNLPGCIWRAETKDAAIRKVQSLALQFLAAKVDWGELAPPLSVEFREAKPEEYITPQEWSKQNPRSPKQNQENAGK